MPQKDLPFAEDAIPLAYFVAGCIALAGFYGYTHAKSLKSVLRSSAEAATMIALAMFQKEITMLYLAAFALLMAGWYGKKGLKHTPLHPPEKMVALLGEDEAAAAESTGKCVVQGIFLLNLLLFIICCETLVPEEFHGRGVNRHNTPAPTPVVKSVVHGLKTLIL